MIEDKNLDNINSDISKVNWSETSEKERNSFAVAMTTFELAKRSQVMAHSSASARLVTFTSNIILAVILIWLSVEPGTILGVCLSAQLLLLGLSQLFEHGANVMLKRSEALMVEMLKTLTKRHPLKLEKEEDIFIL